MLFVYGIIEVKITCCHRVARVQHMSRVSQWNGEKTRYSTTPSICCTSTRRKRGKFTVFLAKLCVTSVWNRILFLSCIYCFLRVRNSNKAAGKTTVKQAFIKRNESFVNTETQLTHNYMMKSYVHTYTRALNSSNRKQIKCGNAQNGRQTYLHLCNSILFHFVYFVFVFSTIFVSPRLASSLFL